MPFEDFVDKVTGMGSSRYCVPFLIQIKFCVDWILVACTRLHFMQGVVFNEPRETSEKPFWSLWPLETGRFLDGCRKVNNRFAGRRNFEDLVVFAE